MSGGDGKVTFTTIYPGWYRGRTVHIHVKVHASGRTAPYSSRPSRETRNANDSIFRGGGSRSTLTVSQTDSGYASTMPTVVRTA